MPVSSLHSLSVLSELLLNSASIGIQNSFPAIFAHFGWISDFRWWELGSVSGLVQCRGIIWRYSTMHRGIGFASGLFSCSGIIHCGTHYEYTHNCNLPSKSEYICAKATTAPLDRPWRTIGIVQLLLGEYEEVWPSRFLVWWHLISWALQSLLLVCQDGYHLSSRLPKGLQKVKCKSCYCSFLLTKFVCKLLVLRNVCVVQRISYTSGYFTSF